MKTTKEIQLLGIIRNSPKSNSQDGGCDEMINLRHADGAFRAVSGKLANTPLFLSPDLKLFRHIILPDDYFITVDNGTRKIKLSDGSHVGEAIPITASVGLTMNATTPTMDATVNIYTGVAPISFLWDDGSTEQSRTGLTEGGYGVTITDDAGTSMRLDFNVPSVSEETDYQSAIDYDGLIYYGGEALGMIEYGYTLIDYDETLIAYDFGLIDYAQLTNYELTSNY